MIFPGLLNWSSKQSWKRKLSDFVSCLVPFCESTHRQHTIIKLIKIISKVTRLLFILFVIFKEIHTLIYARCLCRTVSYDMHCIKYTFSRVGPSWYESHTWTNTHNRKLCTFLKLKFSLKKIFLKTFLIYFKVFTLIFSLEVMLKIIAFSPLAYFRNKSNFFDFIIVAISLIELCLDSKKMLVLRSFRLVNILLN